MLLESLNISLNMMEYLQENMPKQDSKPQKFHNVCTSMWIALGIANGKKSNARHMGDKFFKPTQWLYGGLAWLINYYM